jgi:tRNA-modifying protein YgfZ
MSPSTWQAATGPGALADLSSHVRLRLSGPDAVRYLNGQVTQDVRKLQQGLALPACVTNHKGKLEAWVHLSLDPSGALLISAPEALADFLPLRLEKYLIADDCVLEEVSGDTALVHFTGPAASLTPLLVEGEHPAALPRFGCPGFDLWTTPGRLAFWRAAFPVLSREDQSDLEVLHGVPAWEAELTTDLLPPEAGLEATAIDYHKGCYIGQEVISRIRSVGRVNRHLAHLIQTGGLAVEPGFVLRPEDPAAAPAGTLTRTALHPMTAQWHALAFLRRGATGPWLAGPENGPPTATMDIQKTLDD